MSEPELNSPPPLESPRRMLRDTGKSISLDQQRLLRHAATSTPEVKEKVMSPVAEELSSPETERPGDGWSSRGGSHEPALNGKVDGEGVGVAVQGAESSMKKSGSDSNAARIQHAEKVDTSGSAKAKTSIGRLKGIHDQSPSAGSASEPPNSPRALPQARPVSSRPSSAAKELVQRSRQKSLESETTDSHAKRSEKGDRESTDNNGTEALNSRQSPIDAQSSPSPPTEASSSVSHYHSNGEAVAVVSRTNSDRKHGDHTPKPPPLSLSVQPERGEEGKGMEGEVVRVGSHTTAPPASVLVKISQSPNRSKAAEVSA